MARRPDDICARPDRIPHCPIAPFAMPIYPASVWECEHTDQAEQLLSGEMQGYVYQRDGHPNADVLSEKLRELHQTDNAAITSSGMAAMSLAVLSQLQAGDHVVLSKQLYGKSIQLLASELPRLGIDSTPVDTCDLTATAAAINEHTRLVVVETVANPMLKVADIEGLAELAHQGGSLLLVDNTFASPVLCQPARWGADLVLESISKIVNGHSDVMLGALCGPDAHWQRVARASSAWGLASSPFDSWLAARGLATMALRVERASDNALRIAKHLESRAQVADVVYPGLASSDEHQRATKYLGDKFGWMVTFRLNGGRDAANRFIQGAKRVPFCPSLGELSTTLSHPESTSHRAVPACERAALGIDGGTIRLSVGIESVDTIVAGLEDGLAYLA